MIILYFLIIIIIYFSFLYFSLNLQLMKIAYEWLTSHCNVWCEFIAMAKMTFRRFEHPTPREKSSALIRMRATFPSIRRRAFYVQREQAFPWLWQRIILNCHSVDGQSLLQMIAIFPTIFFDAIVCVLFFYFGEN